MRVALTFESAHPLRRALQLRRLNLDIVDYPGEWLLDLALLDQSYAAWSRDALERARLGAADAPARDWLAYADAVDANAAEDEQVALDGARRFTHYLLETRQQSKVATLGPGRFLMPGRT